MLVKIANKDTESVVSALIKQSQRLPSELYRSLTWDRGKELADHQRLTLATKIDVYFCDPRCPWQRGSNENTNRLLRRYLPRGIDLSLCSQAKLSAIAKQLNERPRKTLLFQTPLRSSQNVLLRSVEPAPESGGLVRGAILLPMTISRLCEALMRPASRPLVRPCRPDRNGCMR
jgi:IS30 family transposase